MAKIKMDKEVNDFSRFAAAYLITANALGLMNRVLEKEAHKLGQEHKQETKEHLKAIAKAAKGINHSMDYFTEWAYGAAVTEEGELCSPKSYDVLMNDASYLAQLICHVFNASNNDPNTRIMLESYAKLASKQQPIKQSIIDRLKVNHLNA